MTYSWHVYVYIAALLVVCGSAAIHLVIWQLHQSGRIRNEKLSLFVRHLVCSGMTVLAISLLDFRLGTLDEIMSALVPAAALVIWLAYSSTQMIVLGTGWTVDALLKRIHLSTNPRIVRAREAVLRYPGLSTKLMTAMNILLAAIVVGLWLAI